MLINRMFVESKICPLGIDVKQPAFSWGFAASSVRSQKQAAYRVIAALSEEALQQQADLVWDSGKTASGRNVHVLYNGKALVSRQKYVWKVFVWNDQGEMFESGISSWEMGLLEESDWSAAWIGEAKAHVEAGEIRPMPLFRHEFVLDKPIASARAYICGLGQYELRLNGSKVTDHVLEPGWTNFNKTVLYNVYDITNLLQEGANAAGVMLGNGFYNVPGGRYKKFKDSFGNIRCLVQLEVKYTDGTASVVNSGPDWRTTPGPVTFACIYGGEDYDARLELPGWDQPDYKEADSWLPAEPIEAPSGKLKAQGTAPLKVMTTFQTIAINEPYPGMYVADLGQNFSGWVQLKVQGPAGSQVILSTSETLKPDGKANQKYTGSPTRLIYTLKGDGEEVWSPRFTYSGFRYVQIEGAVPASYASEGDDRPVILALEGQMIYPDTPVTGSFESSDSLFNRIHEIINWAMLSNMKSIFTDCPHREKLGWLEQVHLVGPGLAYNYDVEALLIKTLEDIRDTQLPNGMVPTTAPEYVVFSDEWRCFRDSVSWGATYILAGRNLLSQYGNSRILTEHYEGMRAYIDYLLSCSNNYIVGHGLGDWYDVGENTPGFVQNTPVEATETAMFYHLVDVFTEIAELLKNDSDALKYGAMREEIKKVYNDTFLNRETIQYATGSQCANAMPLVMGIAEEDHKEQLLAHLVADIEKHGYHTTAGDVGYRYVLLSLALNGRNDIIYKMTSQTDHPSYGYQVVNGATTLTEAWDGPTIGKSQNHFMLGHIEEWFYQSLGGIGYEFDPAEERYRITVRPAVVGEITYVATTHELPSGTVSVQWEKSSGQELSLRVVIPANCEAAVYVPASSMESVMENGQPLSVTNKVQAEGYSFGYAELRIGSGTYHFSSKLKGE